MKNKNIYTARIAVDDELLSNLGPDRIGCMESWNLMSQGASYSIYLFVPDLNTTDTFSFDVLFDDNFRKNNDVKIGDRFPVSIPFPTILRQIEITGIQKGDPINTLENKRPVKESIKSVSKHLEWHMYHYLETDECHDEEGWFTIEGVINYLAKIRCLADLSTLETIVNKDEDHRYIFNEDKTKLRISPDHPAPKYVEEQLKTVDDLKIKSSVFLLNHLPTVKDKKMSVRVDCSDGGSFKFPFRTNKIFFMDKKHFFMLLESHGDIILAVSPYMMKDRTLHYRMFIKGFPDVINHFFPLDAKLTDYEGKTYQVTVI